ncbi:hypothetical protein [Gemmatimonas sp.]|uniref:hypothetical protein n=1 Tax=Gemmatimonas sp. TaxID=1962908 RepID=UPI003DA34883
MQTPTETAVETTVDTANTWAARVLAEIPECPVNTDGVETMALRARRIPEPPATANVRGDAVMAVVALSGKLEDALSGLCARYLHDAYSGDDRARESWRTAMAARRLNDEACAILQGSVALTRKVRR